MIKEFVERWVEKKSLFCDQFRDKHPDAYLDIVRAVISTISSEDEYDDPDPDRIHQIDDGAYQGTLVYVIAAKGYQPSRYWYVMVSYGSCSGCDTLQSITLYEDGQPTAEQLGEYLTLGLHIVQSIKPMHNVED